MRLLNVHTGRIDEFNSDDTVPAYAILSHTWGSDEVTLRDWETLPRSEVEAKAGWEKISHCRRQAGLDGFGWVWVDT